MRIYMRGAFAQNIIDTGADQNVHVVQSNNSLTKRAPLLKHIKCLGHWFSAHIEITFKSTHTHSHVYKLSPNVLKYYCTLS